MIKYLALIFFLPLQLSLKSEYKRHKQACSIDGTVDRTWNLTLRKDSTFALLINDTDNLKGADEVRKASQQSWGKWTVVKDTLTLSPYLNQKPMKFVIDGNRLVGVKLESEVVRGLVMRLDYLESE